MFVCVSETGIMWILLEVKGSEKISHHLKGERGEHIFSQMLQQVALALLSRMWKRELLCGVVTSTDWYLFKVHDVSSQGSSEAIRLEIDSMYVHCIRPLMRHWERVSIPPSLENLAKFFVGYLASS